MTFVPMFKCTGHTYNEFSDDLLKFAVARKSGSKHVDIVFNVYYENSIKSAERENRSAVQNLLAHIRLRNGVSFSQMETIKQN